MPGVTIFLTGLSGAGKTTIARALEQRLVEAGRTVTVLDGDELRRHLSDDLGFTPEDRDRQVLRAAYVAAEIVRHGGIVICALIAPYERSRQAAAAMVRRQGAFVLVHVTTALAVCEARDAKGLYARARAGAIDRFTGISDPYETPVDADVSIDGGAISPAAAADVILTVLR